MLRRERALPGDDVAVVAVPSPAPAVTAEVTLDRVDTAHPRRWLILRFALIGQFLIASSVATVNVALPSIRADLHASAAQMQWLIVLYLLSFAIVLVTGGRLGDMFGRRRLFLLGTLGFLISSSLAGAAPNIGVLVAARLIQGVAGGLASPQVLAIVQVIFPVRERAAAISRFAMVSGGSFMAGQLLTGALLRIDVFGLGWRAAFLMNVPLGIIAFIGASILFPGPPTTPGQRLDLRGALLASAAMLMLLYPLIQGRSAGWPPLFFVVIAASVPAFWLFQRHERRLTEQEADPLVDVRLFEARSFRIGLLLNVALQTTLYPCFLFVTITLQSGLGYDPWRTALTLTPAPVALVISAAFSSRVIGYLGRSIVALGAIIMGTAMVSIIVVFEQGQGSPNMVQLFLALSLMGFGQGLVLPVMVNATLIDVATTHAGAASGVLQTVQQLAGAVGVAVIGVAFFGVIGARTSEVAYRHGLELGCTITIGLDVLLIGLHFLLPRKIEPAPLPATG